MDLRGRWPVLLGSSESTGSENIPSARSMRRSTDTASSAARISVKGEDLRPKSSRGCRVPLAMVAICGRSECGRDGGDRRETGASLLHGFLLLFLQRKIKTYFVQNTSGTDELLRKLFHSNLQQFFLSHVCHTIYYISLLS